jgi:hypothetical protein
VAYSNGDHMFWKILSQEDGKRKEQGMKAKFILPNH